ncbi:MAG: hypothetical protein HZC02_04550 [Candidatus Levybacteria bacterium]|nr:hypothetical protein [Candidatus Levybacteria bacterium]
MVKAKPRFIKKTTQKKSLTLYIIGLLIVLSIFISFILQSGSPFFLQLAVNSAKIISPNYDYSEIYKKEKVRFEIETEFSYLGIISVRFNTFRRISEDSLIFRIKEKGQKNWYYQNIYKTDQFQNNELFPFGFPPISNSRGKTYVFEIESKKGKPGDAVAVSRTTPNVSSTFQYSLQKFFYLGFEGVEFIIYKYLHGLGSVEKDIVVLSPFILFFLYKAYIKNNNAPSMIRMTFMVLMGATLFYIVLLGRILPGEQTNNQWVTILLFLVWFIFILRYRVQSRIWLALAAFVIFLIPIILISFKRPDMGERAGLVAYGFLVIAVLHGFLETIIKSIPKLTAYEFLLMLIPSNIKKRLPYK